MRDRVVICGVTGYGSGGAAAGIAGLVRRLRERLGGEFGIPDKCFFTTNWNVTFNSTAWGAPDVSKILQSIREITADPAYLALVGHSFGGWAVTRATRQLEKEQRIPDFVGLIDVVYNVNADKVEPVGKSIYNWYQTNDQPHGASFARVSGVVEEHVKHQENWDREPVMRRTFESVLRGGRKFRQETTHGNIDANEGIWRDVHDAIQRALTELLS